MGIGFAFVGGVLAVTLVVSLFRPKRVGYWVGQIIVGAMQAIEDSNKDTPQ